jgi:DNA-3-methyladenine glycosylase
MAMGITLEDNWLDLCGDRLFVEDQGLAAAAVQWGPRIGIRVGTERPWRVWADGNPAVSGARSARQRKATAR